MLTYGIQAKRRIDGARRVSEANQISWACALVEGASGVAIHGMTHEKSADAIVVSQKLGAGRCPLKLRYQNPLDS